MPLTIGLDWGERHPRRLRRRRDRAVRPHSRSATTPPASPSCARLAVLAPAMRPAGRHRAAVGPARRCPGRGRPSGRPDPSQRRQGLPPALPRRRRQDRPRRRLHAGRPAAHRRPPLPPLQPQLRRDPGAARPGARPRRPGRRPASRWPTSCAACSRASGPAPPPSSPTSTARSRWPSSSATRRRRAPAASARSAWPLPRPARLLRPPHARRAAGAPARRAHRSVAARPRPRPRARSSAPWPPCSSASSRRSRRLTARIEHAVADLPDGRIVMSFPRAGRICAAQILAELGDVRERFPTADASSPPRPASPRSPTQSGKSRGRHLPLGLQQTPARGRHLLRRQLPPRLALGRRPLPPRPRPRLRPSPRHPHPRPRLAARPLARLAGQQDLRSRYPPRCASRLSIRLFLGSAAAVVPSSRPQTSPAGRNGRGQGAPKATGKAGAKRP